MVWSPVFQRVVGAGGECSYRVGHVLVDEFLEFAEGRARPNTVRAYAHDLKVFFEVVGKEPAEVTSADVLAVHHCAAAAEGRGGERGADL